MKLWECIFKVDAINRKFVCVDYVWSTTKPTNVGHYWSKLFNYSICPLSVAEIQNPPAHELKYQTINLLEEVS